MNTAIPTGDEWISFCNADKEPNTQDVDEMEMLVAASEVNVAKMRQLSADGVIPTTENWQALKAGAIEKNDIHVYCLASSYLDESPDKEQLACMVGRAVRECDVDRILYAQHTLCVEFGLADLNRVVLSYAFIVFKEKLFDGRKPTNMDLWLLFKNRHSISFKYEHRKIGTNDYLRLLSNISVYKLWELFNKVGDTFGENMCNLLKEKMKALDTLLDGNIP